VLAFELTSALATIQKLIEHTLSGLHWKIFLIYLNDVTVIFSRLHDSVSCLPEILVIDSEVPV